MKQLFLVCAFTLMHQIHADDLSDAIRTCNVEKVKTILALNLPQKNFVKYLDTAEQTVRLRRDALMAQKVNPCFYDNAVVHSNKIKLFFCSSLIAMVSVIYHEKRDNESIVLASVTSAGVTSLLALYYLREDLMNSTRYVRQLYEDAVIVKELLYDHLSTIE